MEGLTVVCGRPSAEAKEIAEEQLRRVGLADRMNYYRTSSPAVSSSVSASRVRWR